ncbi:MAG: FAD-binding oxidoreductase [Chloroflexi bacterium]|nr:MAG: FAD-binding oxidoreductase [Chloroflexota bacterium]
MSKVAEYLSEHILGEVTTNKNTLSAFSTDASVLSITPEMVVYPRTTNDIRKIARFSWQLAEKGHILPITARGAGSDQTGAAIGRGVIVNTTAHMNSLFELDSKQKLVRLQPGVLFKTLNDSLALQGLHIPSAPSSAAYSTVGGAIANNASGILSGKYGSTKNWVHQLEVVLASGDVLQTGRISKRELNRKKGMQTFEGEIYRQIDNLINDNQELIDSEISSDIRDNVGYSGIEDVKRSDGSIDLMPLFLGSQGTLGIVSEIIMRTEFLNTQVGIGALAFDSYDAARDAIDDMKQLEPSILEVIDGQQFEAAQKRGKKYAFYNEARQQSEIGAVLVFGFDEFSERVRRKKEKKVVKLLADKAVYLVIARDTSEANELLLLRDVSSYLLDPTDDEQSAPPLVDGAYVPSERFEDFAAAVALLAKKHHVSMPLYGHAREGVFYARPQLHLKKVSDKQKIFKLLGEYSELVTAHHGHLIGESAEGRLKAPFARKQLSDEVIDLFAAIKSIFDPQGILNPGVKQDVELKALVAMLRPDYDLRSLANHSPSN